MKCQNLFSGKNKKNISKCLLKFLPRVLSTYVHAQSPYVGRNMFFCFVLVFFA